MLTLFRDWLVGARPGWLLGPSLFCRFMCLSGIPCTVCAPSLKSDVSSRFLLVRMTPRSQDVDTSRVCCSWAVIASLSSLLHRTTHTRTRTHSHSHTIHTVLFVFILMLWVCTYACNLNLTWQNFPFLSYCTFIFLFSYSWKTAFLTSLIDCHWLCPIL